MEVWWAGKISGRCWLVIVITIHALRIVDRTPSPQQPGLAICSRRNLNGAHYSRFLFSCFLFFSLTFFFHLRLRRPLGLLCLLLLVFFFLLLLLPFIFLHLLRLSLILLLILFLSPLSSLFSFFLQKRCVNTLLNLLYWESVHFLVKLSSSLPAGKSVILIFSWLSMKSAQYFFTYVFRFPQNFLTSVDFLYFFDSLQASDLQ